MKQFLLASLVLLALVGCAAKQQIDLQSSATDDLDLSVKAAKRQKRKEIEERLQQQQKRGAANVYTFEESTVQGYMDSPTPFYITDADHSTSVKTTSSQSLSGEEERRLLKELESLQNNQTQSQQTAFNTEEKAYIEENSYSSVITDPLSTISIDVDNASYTTLRRDINSGYLPRPNTVRIEECINYFSYDYEEPKGEHPFSTHTEVGICPWDSTKKLLHVGLKGKSLFKEDTPQSNLVFLLDVSGSMSNSDKLPLLKQALPLLVDKLNEKDRVSIVVYASASGVVLRPTEGSNKEKILKAVEKLNAGGSTAGGKGIQLAYKIAEENFIEGGNNRIILATDGDFNVGISSTDALVSMMKEKRQKGIGLTVLGFGRGNYKDSRMEQIADKGDGNYFYIDNILEAKKVLVTEMTSTLHTIAKDVKLQIEFNPAKVAKYRLVGYVNRKLANADFDDDTKDAGELGAGHTVTALYEIVPASDKQEAKPLKYQEATIKKSAKTSNEIATLKLRYKEPTAETSILMETVITDSRTQFASCSENFRFATTVAEFAMKVNQSTQMASVSWKELIEQARLAKGSDLYGYRAEFIQLIEKSELCRK